MSTEQILSQSTNPSAPNPKYEYLEAYAHHDAVLGSPNPRYKQSTIYANAYLEVRIQLVGTEGLTDAEWDLTIF